jgi:hypothetical protein
MKQLSRFLAVSRRRRVAAAAALVAVAAGGCAANDTDEQAKTVADHASYVEQTRCAGVQAGAEVNTVLSGQAVTAIHPLYSAPDGSKSIESQELRGATITVSAQPGMTAEWLDRVLECHSAAETLGQAPDHHDPFFLRDAVVDISVQPAKDGFAIHLSTYSPHNAQRILNRATAWAAVRPPAVSSR